MKLKTENNRKAAYNIGFVQVGLMEVIEHLEFYLAFIQNLNFGNSNSPPAQSRHRYALL